MLTTAGFELVQQLHHATEIGNVARGGARHFHLGGHWRGQFSNKGICQWSM